MKRRIFALAYAVSSLLTALLLSWALLAQWNFFYGFWHDHVGIAEGIERYGPQNHYRENFADTTREERIRLFEAINRSIHAGGKGLANIRYSTDTSEASQTLLRPPEIVHLRDVADLLTQLKWLGLGAAIVWLGCCGWALAHRRPLPKTQSQLLVVGGILLFAVVVVIIMGPVDLFNRMHVWIFPDEHQWFFYYQDSLMSTMMLAPRLFGWIAAAWIPLALAFFLVMQLAAGKAAVKWAGKNSKG